MDKEHEAVLTHLLGMERTNGNQVFWPTNHYRMVEGIDANRVLAMLESLGATGYISLRFQSAHHTIETAANITILPAGLNYVQNVQEKKKVERNEWIKWAIPTVLSGIAIVLSIIALAVAKQ